MQLNDKFANLIDLFAHILSQVEDVILKKLDYTFQGIKVNHTLKLSKFITQFNRRRILLVQDRNYLLAYGIYKIEKTPDNMRMLIEKLRILVDNWENCKLLVQSINNVCQRQKLSHVFMYAGADDMHNLQNCGFIVQLSIANPYYRGCVI